MAQSIRVLGDALINRIAAGEVVERPASVVKELVENSLDAGSSRVLVRVESGGRRSIRVEDDGCGMDRDDAILCLERHATSKLRRLDDLESIATMGFRGEALSSIAAVSVFTLQTATSDGAGTEVRVRGGKIESVRDVGSPRGTAIQADRLFFNVPARRKFLRTESTELGHVARWVTRYALANPQVRFELHSGERSLIHAARADDRGMRLAQLYGESWVGRLLPFALDQPGLRVEGFAGRPADAVPRRDTQHLFVNGRAVQDRVLLHAVRDAYGNTTPSGRFPAVFLFLDIDPQTVDVNVHPQKTEVRFSDGRRVHAAVRDAIAAAHDHSRVVPNLDELTGPRTPRLQEVREATLGYLGRGEAGRREPRRPIVPPRLSGPRGVEEGLPLAGEATPAGAEIPPPQGEAGASATAQTAPASAAASEATRPLSEDLASPVVPLAQYRQSYIVAHDEAGLLIVDQHAAHERVLFERFLEAAEKDRVDVQQLLFPLTLDLAPEEAVLVEGEREELRRLGFHVEPFGGNTIRLDAVPAVTASLDPEAVFRELIGEAAQARSTVSSVAELRRKLVTTAACKAAVKFNDALNLASMQALLDDLFRCNSPSTCPHGRPLLFRLTDRELERVFGRA